MRRVNGFLFFWGDWPSNWEYSPFKLEGIRYNCVEQYMMAEKARLFGDHSTLKRIMSSSDPATQKRLGRSVAGFKSSLWDGVRYQVVFRGNLEKYRQNPELRKLLLETGNDKLVEASPEDKIWGIGMRKDERGVENPKNWKGQNLLGKAITQVRETIRKEFPNERP